MHVSSWAWKLPLGDPAAKLVLLKLADCANDEGACWPSIATMVRDTGLSKPTVMRRLGLLEELGILERRPRRDGQRQGSNLYVIRKPGSQPETLTQTPSSGASGSQPESLTQTPEPSVVLEPSLALSNESAHATVFDALKTACFPVGATLTARQAKQTAIAAREIGRAGGDGAEVLERARRYRTAPGLRDCLLTPMALAGQWAILADGARASLAPAPCGECGIGGGLHLEECSRRAA